MEREYNFRRIHTGQLQQLPVSSECTSRLVSWNKEVWQAEKGTTYGTQAKGCSLFTSWKAIIASRSSISIKLNFIREIHSGYGPKMYNVLMWL